MENLSKLYGIIYRITNLINEKSYIGQTIQSLESRIDAHHKNAQNGSNFAIHRAIRKYGIENFKYEILTFCESNQELNDQESFYISYFNTFTGNKNHKGYNMTSGGSSKKYSDEVREKLSKRASEKIGDKNPFFNRKHSDESRAKMSLAQKNRIRKRHSDETKFKMSNSSYLAKTWEIVNTLTGEKISIKNLSQWCRGHEIDHKEFRRSSNKNIPIKNFMLSF